MKPTDVSDPQYYHRVVDCQWGCPAHTDVPEYIRLVARGRFTEAYMVNRRSNVFPGILGRTCDRSCEPACRRTRLDGEPVAICRLKRVAADLRDDVEDRLPRIPEDKNGRRIACVGAGPASLTVTNPLGLRGDDLREARQARGPHVDQHPRVPASGGGSPGRDRPDPGHGGGPAARLTGGEPGRPGGRGMGRRVHRLGSAEGKGARASGPPRHREHSHRHRVAGVGPLRARDEIRPQGPGHRGGEYGHGLLPDGPPSGSRRREGHGPEIPGALQGLAVGAGGRRGGAGGDRREPRAQRLPRGGRETGGDGVRAGHLAPGPERAPPEGGARPHHHPMRRGDPGHRAGHGLSLDRAGHGHRVQRVGHARRGPGNLHDEPGGGVCRGRRGVGPREHHLGGRAWSSGGHLHPRLVRGPGPPGPPSIRPESLEPEDGAPRVELLERLRRRGAQPDASRGPEGAARANACVDVCSLHCLTIGPDGPEEEVRERLSAPALNPDQPLFGSEGLPQTGRLMLKDEDLCIHCRLCAERCPTAAWDIRKSELLIPYAGLDAGGLHATAGGSDGNGRGPRPRPAARGSARVEEARA